MIKFLQSQVLFLIFAVVAAMLAAGDNKNPKSNEPAKQVAPSVASEQENTRLQHTEGGVTTRDDATDMGVPMLPGSPDEPVGPEDALGVGPKRGDYSQRIGPSSYHPHEVRLASVEAQRDPNRSSVKVQAQRPRADEIGEVEGLKGGVDTAPDVRNPSNRSR